jgi:uncharacterized protein
MHIIIDGYNMIRQSDVLRSHERLSLEKGRNALIHKVALYKKIKGHQVTIVFDGWDGGMPTEERDRQEGIDIIYSRQGEKADDVIKRLAAKRAEEIIVVTSDRDIAVFVHHRGGTAISSPEFEALMDRAVSDRPALVSCGQIETDAKDDDDDDDEKNGKKKKGASRRLSRKQKAAMKTVRKL